MKQYFSFMKTQNVKEDKFQHETSKILAGVWIPYEYILEEVALLAGEKHFLSKE